MPGWTRLPRFAALALTAPRGIIEACLEQPGRHEPDRKVKPTRKPICPPHEQPTLCLQESLYHAPRILVLEVSSRRSPHRRQHRGTSVFLDEARSGPVRPVPALSRDARQFVVLKNRRLGPALKRICANGNAHRVYSSARMFAGRPQIPRRFATAGADRPVKAPSSPPSPPTCSSTSHSSRASLLPCRTKFCFAG